VQADTIVPELGNPQDINRYTYVRNNPLGYSDPSGNSPLDPLAQLVDETLDRFLPPLAAQSFVGNYEWKNPSDNDFFEYFVNGQGDEASIVTMNCWETVLFSAYKTNRIEKDWIKDFYDTAVKASDPTASIWDQLGASTAQSISDYSTAENGDLIFFTPVTSSGTQPYPAHVALSLGSGEVISLWYGPNNDDSVQKTTIAELVDMMKNGSGFADVNVSAGHPFW
jgi:hypothetical protein